MCFAENVIYLITCVVQLLALKGKESNSIENRPINLNKESTHHEGSWSNGSDNSCDHVNTTAGIANHLQPLLYFS